MNLSMIQRVQNVCLDAVVSLCCLCSATRIVLKRVVHIVTKSHIFVGSAITLATLNISITGCGIT